MLVVGGSRGADVDGIQMTQGFKFMWIDMAKRNSPCGGGLDHPTMVTLGMIYYWGTT